MHRRVERGGLIYFLLWAQIKTIQRITYARSVLLGKLSAATERGDHFENEQQKVLAILDDLKDELRDVRRERDQLASASIDSDFMKKEIGEVLMHATRQCLQGCFQKARVRRTGQKVSSRTSQLFYAVARLLWLRAALLQQGE